MIVYDFLSNLTETYLDGKLKGIQMNYEGKDTVVINLIYQDKYNFKYNYIVVMDLETRKITHASHTSDGNLSTVKIDRHKVFEAMLFEQMFKHGQIGQKQLIA